MLCVCLPGELAPLPHSRCQVSSNAITECLIAKKQFAGEYIYTSKQGALPVEYSSRLHLMSSHQNLGLYSQHCWSHFLQLYQILAVGDTIGGIMRRKLQHLISCPRCLHFTDAMQCSALQSSTVYTAVYNAC